MGNHLHGVAEIVAAALLLDDRRVDGAGGHVGVAPQVRSGEPFVVTEVEIGLAPVVGDEHLAVLERVHRPRVDVDVGVELLVDDAKPAGLQEAPERCCGDALAEAADHAAGNEDVLGHVPRD